MKYLSSTACSMGLLLAARTSANTNTPADASPDGTVSPTDGSTDSASVDSAGGDGGDVPGGPASPSAAIHVVINGQPRTFDGSSSWTKFPYPDGGPRAGFDSNAVGGDATLVMGVLDGTQTANTCADGAALISIDKGPLATPVATWGGTAGATCAVNVTQYGPLKGDHVIGTFSAELDLSAGASPLNHLSLTNGTFDLVQSQDTPP